MAKHRSLAPRLPLQLGGIISCKGPALLARQAELHGPVLQWVIPYGPLAGRDVVFLGGPEAGRLYSPVFNVPRQVVEDVDFGGYTLPKGTIVRLALAAGHRLSTVFECPAAFDPDRFAPPREEDRRTPYWLVRFGGGPRLCIGMHFANIEVKALAAHVLGSCQLEPLSA